MTISNTIRTAGPFIGNGVTKDFPFSYKVFARSDVLVALTVTATGVETIKTLDADYTVTLNGNQDNNPGGVIRMSVAPPVGTTLAATSNIPLVQSLDLTNQGGFYPRAINDALDRMVVNIQQLAGKIGQGLGVGLAATTDAALSALATVQQLGGSAGSTLVGFLQAGAGAVLRNLRDKVRESVSVKDFGAKGDGVTDDKAAIQAAINYAKSNSIGCVYFPAGIYKTTGRINVLGNFGFGGIELRGRGATLKAAANDVALYISPAGISSDDAASEYRQLCLVRGLNITGPGKASVASVGVQVQQGANVTIQDCRISGFYRGLHGYGALICSFSRLLIEHNYFGIDLLPTTPTGAVFDPQFSPNDLHFYNCQLISNVRAIRALSFPAGAITFDGCEIEGNNLEGNVADGVRVMEFFNAGKVTFLGCHMEENPGEFNLYYHGNNAFCHLNIIGGEITPGDSCGNCVYLSNASGAAAAANATIIGTRITNNVGNQLYISEGFKVTIVGPIFGGIQGYAQNLTLIQDGKIAVGAFVANEAKMRAKAATIVSPAFDIFGLLQITDIDGSRRGYMGNNFDTTFLLSDGTPLQLGTNAGTRLILGRIANSMESNADNVMSVGTGSYRMKEIYAATGTIQTSDGREKREREGGIEAAALRAWGKVGYTQFKWLHAIEQKGEAKARWHFGVIAQRVKEAFESEGLDPFAYGVVCFDEWDAEPAKDAVVDDKGEVVEPARPARAAGNRYGIRYEEALALECAFLRSKFPT